MSKPLKLCLLLCALLLTCKPCLAEHSNETSDELYNYHWGRGLTLPAANLNIGGYFKSSYQRRENRPENFALDDFSLFITWSPHDRLRFFAEIEQRNWLTSTNGVANFNDTLSVERLFVDYLVSDSTTLRFGKFLTPFGRWNIIHSAPLVWTTNRPVVTDGLSFAPRANGLLFSHTHLINEHNLDVTLYIDDSTDLEPKSNTILFDKAAGGRINYEISEQLQIGASYLAYQKLADLGLPTHHVIGIDAMWQNQGYELLFESLYHFRNDQNANLDEKGMFIQGVAPIAGQVSAVGRYEYFNSNVYQTLTNDNVTHIGITGLAWRPFVPLVFKTEYRFGNNNKIIAPSGLFISIAMFF